MNKVHLLGVQKSWVQTLVVFKIGGFFVCGQISS
jgi:hypothetical protein